MSTIKHGMYEQIETQDVAVLENGSPIKPVATLKSDAGGVAHIFIDDHCYVLGLEWVSATDGSKHVIPTTHVFPEAFEAMKKLPDLRRA